MFISSCLKFGFLHLDSGKVAFDLGLPPRSVPNVKLVLTFEKRELLFLNLVFRDDDENFVLPVSCFATRKRIFPLNLGLLDENVLEISLLLVFGTEIENSSFWVLS